MTTIDISAENGGLDAHQAIAPHFKALKAASKAISFSGFPLPELAFILRVDGNVSTYGPPGPGNLDFDRKRQWVSVDIVVSAENWQNRGAVEVAQFIAASILASVTLLRDAGGKHLSATDWEALVSALHLFCKSYEDELERGSTLE
jgi:hypothetical protein